jgi:nucleotide-binding universal stress UspA family protein
MTTHDRCVTRGAAMRVNKILVPTDFSPNAQLAFERATDLARQLGAGLYVLHVTESSPMRTAIQANVFVPGSTDASLKANVLELLGSRLSEFVAGRQPGDPLLEQAIMSGEPVEQILEVARSIHADLIVLGMRGTSWREKMQTALFGSVAERVLRQSPCPVVVVRPPSDRP